MSTNVSENQPATLTPPHADQTTIPRSAVIALVVLLFTAFVMMINETTLAVALPSIMAHFSISAATAQWLLTGFLLTTSVVLPTTGWLIDRFNTRAVFIFATSAFLIGTVMAALAPSFTLLLLARVCQAIGTGVIMPLLMTVTMTLVPASRRGSVMGLTSVVMAVGPALGPTVAGLILSFTTWRGIFWFMVPLMAAAALIGTAKLTNIGESRATGLDLPSIPLSVLAFGGLVYGLSSVGVIVEGGQAGRRALIVLIAGILGLALFVRRQLARGRKGRALLDLRPLAIPNFTVSLVVLVCLCGALFGALNTLPLYLQGSISVTALVTGLVLLPGGLLEGFLSPFVGRIFDRRGPRPLIIPGVALTTGSLFWLATGDEHTSVGLVVAIHIIFSIGLALTFTPLLTTALSSIPKHLYSHGSAILNTLQQLAGATGTAVMITIYSRIAATAQTHGASGSTAFAMGARSAFLVSAAVVGVALVASFFITRVPSGSGRIQTAPVAEELRSHP
ncbi:MAG: multidrug efflux MFS transporter [Actinobacteria bacterium]|nr:multidrug efflux MFS transporter [Actinomycetota bacterium]